MDRDVALRLINGLNNIKTYLSQLVANTPEVQPESAGTTSMSPALMSVVQEPEELETVPAETVEDETVTETTTRKKSTSK